MRSLSLAALFVLFGSTAAKAEPISAIIALITSITASISAGISALGVTIFGATAWAGLTAFLSSPIGSLLVGLGLSLASSLFVQKPGRKTQVPSIEAGKVNVRVAEPERWLCAGVARQGGAVVFAEFDAEGWLWVLFVHCDSELMFPVKWYFDDVLLEVDSGGNVLNSEFCLDNEYNIHEGDNSKNIYFRMWTTTFSPSNPVPPALDQFVAAFPTYWTSDHKLTGTTYTALRILNLPIEHRHKIYRWRGVLGMGEPSLGLVGQWSRIYDPRDSGHDIDDPSTWEYSSNTALIWAWFRTHRYGRGKPMSSINWERVAEQADICDEIVVGAYGSQPRYECGIAIPESKERVQAEMEILLACDGQIVFDDDGKCWVRVGKYEAPTLYLKRNRDIIGMESVEAQNGESETQGVIVRYIDPSANYAAQPCSPWINPYYYVEGETPKYITIDALAIQNHNQAVRLAKSIGLRSQSQHKILPTVGLRGIQARQERIINIQYDNTFSGDYEIVTPVEVDESGMFFGFGAVPVDQNRWDLLSGEEYSFPNYEQIIVENTPLLPTGVSLQFNNNRIEVGFAAAQRKDWRYIFQYLQFGEDPETGAWADMNVNMEDLFAYSGTVFQNTDYYVRWRTVTSSGKSTAWIDPIPTVNTGVIELTGTPVTSGEVGEIYTSFDIDATGGQTPYLFLDLYGRLPPGITINSSTGVVSGTPTTSGTYADIRIRVMDDNNNYANFPPFTITIVP